MKKRILFLFCTVVIINFILAILLNTEAIFEKTDMIALVVGSYIVYWVINAYLHFQNKIGNKLGYSLTLIVGLVVSIIAIFILLFNLGADKSIHIPLMYVISMLVTFLNWFIHDYKNIKKS